MSEGKIVALMLVAAFAVGGVAGVVLALTNASGTAYGLTLFFGAALGGYFSPVILMRLARHREREEREELILSR